MWFKRRFQQGPQDLYMEHSYTRHLAAMIYSFSKKQNPINMIYVITEGGGNLIFSYIEQHHRILLHTSYLFNSIHFGWSYFSSLFSGENSSFLFFFKKKEIEKHQISLLSNCFESLDFTDVCSGNEGFFWIQLNSLKQAELFGNNFYQKYIF